MTLKAFREAYMAARFLEAHGPLCRLCQLWAQRRQPRPCTAALEAMAARDRADALLDVANTPEARIKAWRDRSPSRR